MKSKINFHIHTTYSDGAMTVDEIVCGLFDVGVKTFAITDHDEVRANSEAAALAAEKGLNCIYGVELSCCFDGEIGFDESYVCHVVGLNFNLGKMETELKKIKKNKDRLMQELFETLIKDGYRLNKQCIYEDGRIKERKKFAKELIARGYAADANEAFGKILNNEKYIKYAKNLPTIKEGIAIIKSCGGLAVWAHPFGITRGGKKELTEIQVNELSDSMLKYGIDGMEVYYQKYNDEQVEFLEILADKLNVCKSCGTDYHGVKAGSEKPYERMENIILEQLYFEKDGIIPDVSIAGKIIEKDGGYHCFHQHGRG